MCLSVSKFRTRICLSQPEHASLPARKLDRQPGVFTSYASFIPPDFYYLDCHTFTFINRPFANYAGTAVSRVLRSCTSSRRSRASGSPLCSPSASAKRTASPWAGPTPSRRAHLPSKTTTTPASLGELLQTMCMCCSWMAFCVCGHCAVPLQLRCCLLRLLSISLGRALPRRKRAACCT